MPFAEKIKLLWSEVRPASLKGKLWRMVESQEEVATQALVETLEEQALLEQLLDESKPSYPEDVQDKHYLIATPFRYPPLPWGSRFGQTFERGIFYGSEYIATCLAEVAYYRFVFYQGVSIPLPLPIVTQHTAFSVGYDCKKGADLFDKPFSQFRQEIMHPESYQFTQSLGSHLRKHEFDGLIYPSARCPDSGANIALFLPDAITSSKPNEQNPWVCELNQDHVTFSGQHTSPSLIRFARAGFEINGRFPLHD